MEDEHAFTPARKEIVFNPVLVHNDGLLTESYMQEYALNFGRAMQWVREDVSMLKETLDDDTELQFGRIGIFIKEDDRILFLPDKKSDILFSISSYGLPVFHYLSLALRMSAAGFAYKPVAEDAGADAKKTENPPKSPHIIYTIPVSRTFIRFLGLAAAAVILFLLISIPVKEVDKASYSASFVPQEVMPKKTVDEIVSDAFSATGMGALGNAVNPVDPGLLDSDGYVASPSGGGVAKTSATELPASGGGVSKTPLTESRVSGGGVAKTSATESLASGGGVAKTSATESPASGGGVSKTSATESPASSGGAVTKTPEPEVNAGAKASKAAVGESSSSAKSSTGKKAASALPANTVSKNDSGKYYVIIGSFDTHGRAKAYINRLKGEVAANVGILERDGKIRVYAQQFSTRKSAHSYLNKIRQHTEHKQAWLYEKP